MSQPDAIDIDTIQGLAPIEDKALAMLEEAGAWLYLLKEQNHEWHAGVASDADHTTIAARKTRDGAIVAAVEGHLRTRVD